MSRKSNSSARQNAMIFLVCSVILFLGAIGIFIWLLVDAAEDNMVKNVLYGSAFLVITIGMLIYSLCLYRAPRTSTVILAVCVVLGVAAFIVGLCLPSPVPGTFAELVGSV